MERSDVMMDPPLIPHDLAQALPGLDDPLESDPVARVRLVDTAADLEWYVVAIEGETCIGFVREAFPRLTSFGVPNIVRLHNPRLDATFSAVSLSKYRQQVTANPPSPKLTSSARFMRSFCDFSEAE